jgi:hypothetical protein
MKSPRHSPGAFFIVPPCFSRRRFAFGSRLTVKSRRPDSASQSIVGI